MTFFCIADKESSAGFKLAGVNTREVSVRQEALQALNSAKADKDVGIIMVTEKAAALMREEVKNHIAGNPIPLILEVPSRGQVAKRTSSAELLKELAGF
jgi:V/A-type H+/Na+-transporting ATPase subunit F